MKNTRIVTIHQPETLPWMGFFNKMIMADHYIILDNVDFRKNYFQNRNQILTKQGPSFLTVPIDCKKFKKIKDIRIVNQQKWQKKQLSSIAQSYSKSPFYNQHKDFLESLYTTEYVNLIDFNMDVITYVRKVLDISTPLSLASNYEISTSSTELLLDLCKKENATHYLAGKDGINYLEPELFKSAGIEIVFQDFSVPEYKHFNQNMFFPYMSVFDLLFNHESKEARILIESGDLLHERV